MFNIFPLWLINKTNINIKQNINVDTKLIQFHSASQFSEHSINKLLSRGIVISFWCYNHI